MRGNEERAIDLAHNPREGPQQLEPRADDNVVRFEPPRRPRGRPRKPCITKTPALQTPSIAEFDHIAAGIVGIAAEQKSGLWAAAKERVILRATNDPRRLRPTAIKALVFLMSVINRNKGYDWRSVDTLAAEAGLPLRTAKGALKELDLAGYIQRRTVIRKGGRDSMHGQRTIPALLDAAIEIRRERDVKAGRSSKGVQKNAEGSANKTPAGGANLDTQTFRRNLEKNPSPRERAKEDVLSSNEKVEAAAATRRPLPLPPGATAIEPRYDRKLPLRRRIEIYRYTEPTTREGRSLRNTLVRAARGWDRQTLKDAYCAWMEGQKKDAPVDAMLAFIGWVDATSQRRGPAIAHIDVPEVEPATVQATGFLDAHLPAIQSPETERDP